MKRIQSKLTALGVVALFSLTILAALLLEKVYREYHDLASFKETSAVSLTAYELASNLTVERQMAYQASAFLGEGTPEQMIQRYEDRIQITNETKQRLLTLIKKNEAIFSERFRDELSSALGTNDVLEAIRHEITDRGRSREKKVAQALKSKALLAYDVVLFAQANFLPVLSVETQDSELVRRIVTQDNLARLQKDFWKLKGLVNSVLRDSQLKEKAWGEIKIKALSAEDHLARLQKLSDPETRKAIDALAHDEDFLYIKDAYVRIQDMGSNQEDYSMFLSQAEYHAGPFTRVEAAFAKLGETINQSIVDYSASRLSKAQGKLWTLIGFVALVIAALAVALVMIGRSISRPLRALSSELNDTARRGKRSSAVISESSKRLSEDAVSETEALHDIFASVEQVTELTRANMGHVEDLVSLTRKANASTEKGREQVKTLVDAMDGIQRTNEDIAAIVKTIDEIAFQTNILALNAAVEAARAGEAGAGFAVVADEVRSLAHRSAEAARETAQKIESALASNTRGVKIGSEVQSDFIEIANITGSYLQMVQDIESASSQSVEQLDGVSRSLNSLDGISQRTAAAAEENASAVAEMDGQIGSIREYARRLQRMVRRGDGSGGGANAVAPGNDAFLSAESVRRGSSKPARTEAEDPVFWN